MTAPLSASPSSKRSLNIITVESPCDESWEGMLDHGDGRRHCERCMQDVFDLSAMTTVDAENLVFGQTDVCVRFYRRLDGTVVTSDCTPVRQRTLIKAAGSAVRFGAKVAGGVIAIMAAFGVADAAGVDVLEWMKSTSVGKEIFPNEPCEVLAGAVAYDPEFDAPYEPENQVVESDPTHTAIDLAN